MLTQTNHDLPVVSTACEIWYEGPGCQHLRKESISKDSPAKFYALLIIDDEVVRDVYGRVDVIDATGKMEHKNYNRPCLAWPLFHVDQSKLLPFT